MNDNEYKCAICGNIYTKTTSEEEILKEMKDNFGNVPINERVTVCDDCYEIFMAFYNRTYSRN